MTRWLLLSGLWACEEAAKEPLSAELPAPTEPTVPTVPAVPPETPETTEPSDTGYLEPNATGSWTGDCEGVLSLWFELEDNGGGISGTGVTDGGGCVIYWPIWGWRTGNEVVLDLEIYDVWPVLFELVLEGDTMTGTVTSSPYETTTTYASSFSCELTR